MALKRARPSDIGTTINVELNISRVIHATTSKRTIRRTKLYLLKDESPISGSKKCSLSQ
jgi:hypothetical protein